MSIELLAFVLAVIAIILVVVQIFNEKSTNLTQIAVLLVSVAVALVTRP